MSPLTYHPLEFRTLLYYGFLSLLAFALSAYTLFQARFLIAGPEITLTETIPSIQTERLVTLIGTAQNITKLTLNDREIYTDRAGHFQEALVLENGYTIATLKAEDRYGRRETLIQPFVYTPALVRE